jgi:dihydromethanopterin reductase (acceptor)
MSEKRIAWAITGAGHALEECIEILLKQNKVDLFLSRAGEEVISMYGFEERLTGAGIRIYRDTLASSPLVSRLFAAAYGVLVIAPATSNSVSKFAHGISDTLVTNLFAQAGKARVPVIVYPTDLAPEMESVGPHGERIKVYPRAIDLENTRKLREFIGAAVVADSKELAKCLAAFL